MENDASMLATYSSFYVDESGDLTFFVKNKPVNFDNATVSKYFMIGMVRIKSDIDEVSQAFDNLRAELLQDPFVKKIPSAHKIAQMFHAKDDADIIRREVFKLIQKFDFSVQVIVRRKQVILDKIKEQYKQTGIKTKISEKDIYDSMVSALFKRSLHKNDCKIYFSQRGKTFNEESLKLAIGRAKRNFCIQYNTENTHQTNIFSSQPQHHIGLQIIDYYLWALHRFYSYNDDSYFNLLKDDFKLIIDLDDKRNHKYGEYYDHKSKPISLEKVKGAS